VTVQYGGLSEPLASSSSNVIIYDCKPSTQEHGAQTLSRRTVARHMSGRNFSDAAK